MICEFTDAQRVVGHRVELICQVLREQGLAVTPPQLPLLTGRHHRAARVRSDAAVIDVPRGLRTAGPDGGWRRRSSTAGGRRPSGCAATPNRAWVLDFT